MFLLLLCDPTDSPPQKKSNTFPCLLCRKVAAFSVFVHFGLAIKKPEFGTLNELCGT